MSGSTSETLFLIAQLGLGFAGFSGIAVVLIGGGPSSPRLLTYRVGIMLGATLGATFLALVPVVLAAFPVDPSAAGRMSSALMAAFTVGYVAYYRAALRYMRRGIPELVSTPAVVAVMIGHGTNLLAQGGVALGLLHPWGGIYLAGLFWLLLQGAYQFGRILFIRPAHETESRG